VEQREVVPGTGERKPFTGGGIGRFRGVQVQAGVVEVSVAPEQAAEAEVAVRGGVVVADLGVEGDGPFIEGAGGGGAT
jgi:hypothetical protein